MVDVAFEPLLPGGGAELQNSLGESTLQGQIDAGLLDPAIGETLLAASKLYQDLTQVIRLCITENLDPPSAPPGFQALLARAAGLPDFKTLDAHLRQSEADVEVIVHKLLNGVFEDIRI